jgi:hypothetical protein
LWLRSVIEKRTKLSHQRFGLLLGNEVAGLAAKGPLPPKK